MPHQSILSHVCAPHSKFRTRSRGDAYSIGYLCKRFSQSPQRPLPCRPSFVGRGGCEEFIKCPDGGCGRSCSFPPSPFPSPSRTPHRLLPTPPAPPPFRLVICLAHVLTGMTYRHDRGVLWPQPPRYRLLPVTDIVTWAARCHMGPATATAVAANARRCRPNSNSRCRYHRIPPMRAFNRGLVPVGSLARPRVGNIFHRHGSASKCSVHFQAPPHHGTTLFSTERGRGAAGSRRQHFELGASSPTCAAKMSSATVAGTDQ